MSGGPLTGADRDLAVFLTGVASGVGTFVMNHLGIHHDAAVESASRQVAYTLRDAVRHDPAVRDLATEQPDDEHPSTFLETELPGAER